MNYNKWILLFFNTIVFVLMAWLLPIHYEESDDVVMCMIANGFCSGSPDGHLVFINALYGWLLAGLYGLSKAVEWYTLGFSVLHVLAMTGVVCVVLGNDELKPLLKVWFLVFIYVLWARIIISFQFTTTAGLLCFSGCLALRQATKKWRIVGVCAVFVASLIRFDAAALVGILCSPLLLIKVFDEKRYACWLIGVVLLVMMGYWSDSLFYRHSDWAQYREYNAIRGRINDNPNAVLIEQDLPNGVELQDYRMFCSFKGDPKILTLSKLKIIESEIENNISFHQLVINIVQLRFFRIPLFLLYFGIMLCVILNYKTIRGFPRYLGIKFVAPVVFLLLMTVVLVYLGAMASLKPRVFLCLLFPSAYLLVVCWPEFRGGRDRVLHVLLVLVLSGMMIKYAYQDAKAIRQVRITQKEFDEYQYPLVKTKKGVLYLGGEFHSEFLFPFGIKDLKLRGVGLGWLTNIPFQKGVLDCHMDFVDSNILYFGKKDELPIGLLERIDKNYGIKPLVMTIDKNEKYALYEFVSK